MQIEIVGIWDDKKYSIGKISVSNNGDVYNFHKLIHKKTGLNFHTSRHASGVLHWKFSKRDEPDIYQIISKSAPIKEFEGIEQVGSLAYRPIDLATLSQHLNEYKMNKRDSVCAIDLRVYQEGFNLSVLMLTHEGIPFLQTSSTFLTKRQIYLYADSFPMIGIVVGALKSEN